MFHLLLLAASLPFCLAQYGAPAPSSSSAPTPAAATVSAPVGAQTIQVGANGFTYTPNTLNVSSGGFVVFQFSKSASSAHGVVQSSFDKPCASIGAAGFGTPLTQADEIFVLQVNSTDPLWFYCPQITHCQSGMVGVINPTANETLGQYQAAAKGTSQSDTVPTVQGGVLGVNANATKTSGANILGQNLGLGLLGLTAAILVA